jgi:glycosyltransferase involved in cell wall biosynthesis
VEELVRALETIDTENEYVLFMNAKTYESYKPSNPNFRKVRTDIPHYSLREQIELPIAVASEKLDLMHYTHFNAPVFAGKTPVVVTIHDLTLSFYPGQNKTSPWHTWAYRLAITSVTRRARRIIAITGHTKKDLNEILNVEPEKIAVVYNGVDATRFEREFSEETWQRYAKEKGIRTPYLLATGVHREHKNLPRLVRAYAAMLREHPEISHDLVLVGKEDSSHAVRGAALQEGIEKRVRVIGYVPDDELIALYQHADGYVFPSLYEGFGLPVLEAMAAGVPVACANNSCLPEVAGAGNALFFDPFREKDMERAMVELITDHDLRPELRSRGLERVKEFSWEKMARETLAVYREALDQRR